MPGRLITDNVLLAYELIHHLNSRKKGVKGLAAIKLGPSLDPKNLAKLAL